MTQPTHITPRDIHLRKKGKPPIVCLTAYSFPQAQLLDEHVDILLVGDSLGMVLYGMDSTLPVSIEMMCAHGAAVVRGSSHALVVVDLPFGSYQTSPEDAFESAAYVLKETGASAVKLEGGVEMAPTIAFLTERGIPVMAHIGLKPQHVNQLGGYRYQGRTPQEQKTILEDAKAVDDAGAFCVVLESVAEPLAKKITKTLSIPTIGIGASPACDGQVLVTDDICGVFGDDIPKFATCYGDAKSLISKAAATFAEEVRAGTFPAPKNCFFPKK